MSYTRTNFRVTGAQIDDDAVTSAKIKARNVVASSIATAIVATSHLGTGAVTNPKLAADAVSAAQIIARNVRASSIATAIVAQSHLALNAKFAKGYKSNIKSSTSAVIKVSTGLASPVYGMAFGRASATVANRFKKLGYRRATGSYIMFQLYRQTWTSSNKFKETLYTSSATIQFNWLAFEA